MNIIKNVGCAEYRTVYLHDDGTVWGTLWDASVGKHKYMQYPGVSGAIDVVGGQYTCLAITKDGVAYELLSNSTGGPAVKQISSSRVYVYCQMFNQAKLFVDGNGDLYYLAESADKDVMKLGSSSFPKLILKDKHIKKIVVGEPLYGMLLLTINGEVYQWNQGQQQPLLVMGGANEIAMIGRGAYVVATDKDLFVWGNRCKYLGLAQDVIDKPFALNANIFAWPIKKLSGSWNTLHVIDANGIMWGVGDNMQGEIGNGQGYANWNDYKGASGTQAAPFAWDWAPAQMLTVPTKIDSKWIDVFSGGSMAFYKYAINENGKLYAWGRNKQRTIPTGETLPDNDLSAKYPNWRDVWYPTEVNPTTVEWKVINSFDPITAPNNYPIIKIPVDPIQKKLINTITLNVFDDGSVEVVK
jgi:alpha-tubulin suppressor-like RCC1 family protein